jgi:hypothetical protein
MTLTGAATSMTAAGNDAGISTGYLVLLITVGVVLLAFFIAAVISIAGSPRLTGAGKIGWTLVCLVLQFFGPLGWFLWGRHQNGRSLGGSSMFYRS